MGPRAPRSSHPSSPRAAHEGSKLIFDSSSRSRVSIARASHQRPRSLQTRASRREAPKLPGSQAQGPPGYPYGIALRFHRGQPSMAAGVCHVPEVSHKSSQWCHGAPQKFLTEPPHQRGVHPVMAVGCQTGGVGRGRHIRRAGQWPEVSGGLRAPLKAHLILPRRPTRGLRCSRRPCLLADSRIYNFIIGV